MMNGKKEEERSLIHNDNSGKVSCCSAPLTTSGFIHGRCLSRPIHHVTPFG